MLLRFLYNAKGNRDNFKKELRDEVPQSGEPRTSVFWKVAPCSLLDIDTPETLLYFFQARALSRPRRLHLQQHFPWDIRPTLSKQQIALIDQRQSKPPQFPHFSSSQFSLTVHFAQTHVPWRSFLHCLPLLHKFLQRITLRLFSKHIPTFWLTIYFLTLLLHAHYNTKLLSNVFT